VDAGGQVPDTGSAADGSRASAYAAAVVADGPAAYWRMKAVDGGIADEIGNQNPLTLSGQTASMAGAFDGDSNGAVKFSGGYATAQDARAFDFANQQSFTIEFWLDQDPMTIDDFAHIVTNAEGVGSDPSQVNGWMLYTYYRQSRLALERDAPGSPTSAFGPTSDAGTWTHYVVVYDGSAAGIAIFYINGAVAGTSSIGAVALQKHNSSLYVGAAGPGAKPLSGTLDELAIYLKPLDPTTITRHYNAGTGR
jgi:hypothetical protein